MKPMSPEAVLAKATNALIHLKGDPANRKHLLGFFEIQFGVFRGQTFRWLAENALGYAAYLVAAMNRDPTGGSKDSYEHAHNKNSFKEYMELFPSGRIAIAMKEDQYSGHPKHSAQHSAAAQQPAHTQHTAPTPHSSAAQEPATSQQPAPTQHHATSSLRSLLVRQTPSQNLTKTVQRLISPHKPKPCKQTFIGITHF